MRGSVVVARAARARCPAGMRAEASTQAARLLAHPAPTCPIPTSSIANCHDIDGDASLAIFIAPGGRDDASCGLTKSTPCATVSWSILQASYWSPA